jgi:organic radical activating enzyme
MTVEAREILSKMRLGGNNPNWKCAPKLNRSKLKVEIGKGSLKCGCGSSHFLEVHHIDENQKNDQKNNLVVLCKSCHTKVHKKGYNFWNGDRRDGKQLQIAIGNNGKRVEAIKEFIRTDIPPSVRPKPLKVYNLTCSPYNTFFLDNMWVHNCDTKQSQHAQIGNDSNQYMEMTPKYVAEQIPPNSNVVLTGGEPLLQNSEELYSLVSLLNAKECVIQVETNGTQKPFLPVSHILDYKTPSSGEQDKMMPVRDFLYSCFSDTWIKFVIKCPEDLEFVIRVLKEFELLRPGWERLWMALSIDSGGGVHYAMNRLKEDMPDLIHKIVFNFQLHKHFDLK